MRLSDAYFDGWVLANGVKTHYTWAGTEGPVVILLHGAGPGVSGEAGWRFMLPALAKAGYRGIAVDQLSMGQTDKRPHAWPTRGHQSLVDHVKDFIDALCLDEVYVVGNSQGAYVAVKLALDHPERVKKVVLIGSTLVARAMRAERPKPEGNKKLLDVIGYDYTKEAMVKFVTMNTHDPKNITQDIIDLRHVTANLPGSKEALQAFKEYQEKMNDEPKLWERFSIHEQLPKSSIPMKFIWGIQDKLSKVEIGYELEQQLPNIPFEYIDECGHQCQTDQPEIVNKIVLDFFEQVSSPTIKEEVIR